MGNIYPMPNATTTKNFLNYTTYASGLTDGLLFPIILLVIGIVAFVSTKQYSAPVAFAFTSFLLSILAIPLVILQLLNPNYMYLCFVLSGLGLLGLRMTRNNL